MAIANNDLQQLRSTNDDDIILKSFIGFVQTAQAVLKYVDAHLYRKTHLSITRFVVLQVLDANGGVLTPSKIAEWTQTERHNVTALVDRLKKDGLVRAEQNSKDMRSINIILTEKGQQTLNQAMPEAREIVGQVMLSFEEADVIPLLKSLGALRRNALDGMGLFTKYAKSQPN